MFHSLRFRLLVTFMIVIIVMVGVVGLFSSQATSLAFDRYLDGQKQVIRPETFRKIAENKLRPDQIALLNQSLQPPIARVILLDEQGQVIADVRSGSNQAGVLPKVVNPPPFIVPTVVSANSEIAATPTAISKAATNSVQLATPLPPVTPILAIPRVPPAITQPPVLGLSERVFIDSANGSLWLATIIAGLVALLMTVLLSRRILKPVEELTLAAWAMERGDLNQRVPVRSWDELGTLARAFNSMADKLSRSEQLRRNMVSDVAHELRTPLTNIRAYLEALQDGFAEPSPDMLGSLYEETLLLNRLVDDLQELVSAEGGQLRLDCQPLELAPLIEKVTGSLQRRATEKSLQLKAEISTELPLILADQERIGQVLRNLLTNAMAHTPPDGRIIINARPTDREMVISVRDTGEGISAEHLPYIFERFYRADQSRARATGGSGLGLAIVRQLVEAHGGRVTVESIVGVGTKFTFSLPLAVASQPQNQGWPA